MATRESVREPARDRSIEYDDVTVIYDRENPAAWVESTYVIDLSE
jgi:hypothetical protein